MCSAASTSFSRGGWRESPLTTNVDVFSFLVVSYLCNEQVIGPVVQKAVQEWKSFNRFRDRQQAERRSKTLDWFEDRVQTMQREEGM